MAVNQDIRNKLPSDAVVFDNYAYEIFKNILTNE